MHKPTLNEDSIPASKPKTQKGIALRPKQNEDKGYLDKILRDHENLKYYQQRESQDQDQES